MATNGEKNACRIFMGKPEGGKPLVRQRCRWVDNTTMNLKERQGGVV
jgi:hypothetical protein